MNNRAYAIMTGMFVLLLAAGVAIIAVWMSGSHKLTFPYVVVTTGSVFGLRPESTVYFRGIAAGTVEDIRIDRSDPRNILIDVNINRGIPITRATYATLSLHGVTGLSQLELANAPGPLAQQPLPTSRREPARIPLRPALIDRLGRSGLRLAAQLTKLTYNLNALLNTNNRAHIEQLLERADASSAMLLRLERDLDTTARKLPALDRRAAETLAQMKRAATDISALSREMEHLAAAGQAAGGVLTHRTLPQFDEALAQVTRAAADVQRLASSLRRDPQALLLGSRRPPPGPGEPGYKGPSQ